ncbi:MAG TPA: hypothetical protein VKR32_20500 [Puia sp.]|nr:hypothetical protein [Puia sp.]
MGTKIIIAVFLGLLPCHFSQQSETTVERINGALNTFFEKYPQEKVYLQFDRQHYNSGDTIWYKAYVTYKNSPSTISKILYVEFMDARGTIIKRQILSSPDGAATGSLTLDNKFSSGLYYVRAYTAWMMNFDPGFYFYECLSIDVIGGSPSASRPTKAEDCLVSFYPEGGSLVEGLTSLVGVKAIGKAGFPEIIAGKIIDGKGNKKADLSTNESGLGSFIIHPLSGENYSALIDLLDGSTKKIPLAPVAKSGIVFHTQTGGADSVYFRMSRSVRDKERFEHLIICSEMEGMANFTYLNFDSATAGNNNNTILDAPSLLSTEKFHPGILHLTIFNDQGKPLAERLVYLQNIKPIGLDLKPTELNLAPHALNNFELNIPGTEGGKYSVSVTDVSMDETAPPEKNIVSDILLTSDIKDFTAKSAHLADSRDSKDVDLLMLTSGWSRFHWDELFKKHLTPPAFFPEQSLSIRGRAYKMKKNQSEPLDGGQIPMMIKMPDGTLRDIVTVHVDSAGFFALNNLDFDDSISVYLKNSVETKKHREQNISVKFDRSPVDSINFAVIPRWERQVVISNSTTISKEHSLAPVTISARPRTEADSMIAANVGGSYFDFTNDRSAGHDYSTNVLDFILTNAQGLSVKYENQGGENIPIIAWRPVFSAFVSKSQDQQLRANSPAIFLNDQQLTGEGGGDYDNAISMLKSITLSQVARIMIYPPGTKASASGGSANGVIYITTINRPEARDFDNTNHFDRITMAGFTTVHNFSSPDYATAKNLTVPDNRKTLYWNPNLQTDATHRQLNFSFYNNDSCRRFRVIVEGIDSHGSIMRIDRFFPE